MGVKEVDEAAERLREAERSVAAARRALIDDGPHAEAARIFSETLAGVLGNEPLEPAAARRAALLAAADRAWTRHLGTLYDSSQVRELLGGVSRQRVGELLTARRLIVLTDRGGRRRFPALQFRDGRPLPALLAAFWALVDAPVTEWTAASWCASPHPDLDGVSPAEWAAGNGDGERLAAAAADDAARFAQ